jgi:hypothetical protein
MKALKKIQAPGEDKVCVELINQGGLGFLGDANNTENSHYVRRMTALYAAHLH